MFLLFSSLRHGVAEASFPSLAEEQREINMRKKSGEGFVTRKDVHGFGPFGPVLARDASVAQQCRHNLETVQATQGDLQTSAELASWLLLSEQQPACQLCTCLESEQSLCSRKVVKRYTI